MCQPYVFKCPHCDKITTVHLRHTHYEGSCWGCEQRLADVKRDPPGGKECKKQPKGEDGPTYDEQTKCMDSDCEQDIWHMKMMK